MARLTGLVLALTLTLADGAVAQVEDVTDFDRFRLWNNCGSVSLIVEGSFEKAGEIGLTKETIETAVRSRLRAARIYDSDAGPFIYVYLNVVSPAFGLSFEFYKLALDYVSDQSNYAMTWDTGATGTHGNDSGYILGYVSRFTDAFVDQYLRVNADACS